MFYNSLQEIQTLSIHQIWRHVQITSLCCECNKKFPLHVKRVRRNDDCKIIVGRLFWETKANRPKCRTVILASYFISLAKRSYEDRKGSLPVMLMRYLNYKKVIFRYYAGHPQTEWFNVYLSAGKITHRLLTVNWMGVPERSHVVDWWSTKAKLVLRRTNNEYLSVKF